MLKIRLQRGIFGQLRLPATATLAYPPGLQLTLLRDLLHPAADRAPGDPGDSRYHAYPAMTVGLGFSGRKPA